MKYLALVSALLPLLVVGQGPPPPPKAMLTGTDTTMIHLDRCSGRPQHYAAGVLYGVSGTDANLQAYLKEAGIDHVAAGGAQTSTSGWGSSVEAYKARFATVIDDAKRVHELGGTVIIKTSDLWGADDTQPATFPFPGDNGDWTSYDKFIQQLISDIKSSGLALKYVTQIDVWNEPDGKIFWNRSQDQFLEMYKRGVGALRAAFPQNSRYFLPLVGPSTAAPNPNNPWFVNFLEFVSKNKEVEPDIWNWHMEGGGSNDPVEATEVMNRLIRQYNLSGGIGFQNNEYGTREQQRPGYGAWHAARYEKVKFHGLRGNWAGGPTLRDNLADLLIKKDAEGHYRTTGEYQEWKTYAGMKGSPCTTDAGKSIDSYGTLESSQRTAAALVGNQGFTGQATTVFSSVSGLGAGVEAVNAVVQRIPYNNGGEVTSLVKVSSTRIPVIDNQVSVSFTQNDANDAYLITITAV